MIVSVCLYYFHTFVFVHIWISRISMCKKTSKYTKYNLTYRIVRYLMNHIMVWRCSYIFFNKQYLINRISKISALVIYTRSYTTTNAFGTRINIVKNQNNWLVSVCAWWNILCRAGSVHRNNMTIVCSKKYMFY